MTISISTVGDTLPVPSTTAVVKDSTDTTKEIDFDASGITTGTTRTITMPDADVDLGEVATSDTHANGDGTDHAALVPKPITVTFDGSGSVLTTGAKSVYIKAPHAGTITQATLLADQSGSIVIDVWKDTYANFPPTVADTITAAAKPTLSGAQKSQDSTLTGWTKTFSAGDIFEFNIDSVATITKAILILDYDITGV